MVGAGPKRRVADPANPAHRELSTAPQQLGGESLGNDVVATDLDRDGDLDIVVAAATGAPDRAFVNTAGSFSTAAIGDPGADSRAVTVGDINGDGFVDLAFATQDGATVLVNSGSGASFNAAPKVGTGDVRDALLIELTGDSLPELVRRYTDGDPAMTAQVESLEREAEARYELDLAVNELANRESRAG